MTQADLEIFLDPREAGSDNASYGVELRFTDPRSDAEQRQGGAGPVRFDAVELRQRAGDPAAYGQYLAAQLLAEPAMRSFFDQAVAVAQAQDVPLRLRLNVAPGAPELHDLRWETLRLPRATAPMLTGESLRFSRFLSSLDWRSVRLRPQGELRTLVAVADPSDVTRYSLAPVDREVELAAARSGLGDIATVELATRGQVTLANLAARLRDGYDILYLVAHGMLVEGEPWLFLEKEDGTADKVPGRELATRIQELDNRPRLVVLVSCQGAGTGDAEPAAKDGGALAGLGPRLAEAGVPAVVAMQGNVTIKSAAAFMPLFFTELRRDGQVDRAMSVARGAVRDRPDWWMPVLFMRLKSGRLFEEPELSGKTRTVPGGTLKGWLEAHGFIKGDPFGSWEADKEVDKLRELLIWRPYFDRVVGDPAWPRNVILSAERGAGKSATREFVRNECLSGDIRDRALPVCYVDFTELLDGVGGDAAKVSRRAHIAAILRAGMRALVLAHQNKPTLFNSLSPGARSELLSMAAEFASADCETLRMLVGGQEAKTKWEKVTDIELIDHFVDLVKQMSPSQQRHYESVYVLVDPVVDTEFAAASALLKLLAGDRALRSLQHVAFKFFLPADIAWPLHAAVDPHHDHFSFVSITWDEAALKEMIECRLSHFSDGAIGHTEQLCTPAAVQLLPRVWGACESSPRALLQLCEKIRRHHVERTRAPLFEPEDITNCLL